MRLVPGNTDGKRRFGAVIPAAGLSSRMKAFKPLLPYGECTVIESTVGAVLEAANTAVVVLGNHADEVEAILKKRFGDRVRIVRNPDYRNTDMMYSVQLGLEALEGCDAFFLLPGDMPAVRGATFKALAAAFDESSMVIYPTFNGRKGHPPLICASLIPQIHDHHGEGGLRSLFRDVPQKYIELSDRGITADLDTPEDYAEIKNELTH